MEKELKDIDKPLISSEQRESRYSFHADDQEETPGDIEMVTQEHLFFEQSKEEIKSRFPYYLMCGSSLCMVINGLFVKLLNISTFQLIFHRAYISFFILFAYFKITGTTLEISDSRHKRYVFSLSSLLFFSTVCYFEGINRLPLSEAITVIYTSPIFVALFLWIFLRFKYSMTELLSGIVTLAGVVLIYRPTMFFSSYNPETNLYDQSVRKVGIIICLVNSMLMASQDIIIKNSGKRIHPLTLIVFVNIVMIIIAPIMAFLFESLVMPTFTDFIKILIMSASHLQGQFLLIKAMQMTREIKAITLINYIQMVIAILFDIFIIHDFPEIFSLLGTIIVLFGCANIVLSKKTEEGF